jgi:phage terminase large subunit-like protein
VTWRVALRISVHPSPRRRIAVANARVEPKGNAIIITKQASGFAKIDLLTAALTRYEFTLLDDQRQA